MAMRRIAVLPAYMRGLLEARLPDWVDARWVADAAAVMPAMAGAEIAWLDLADVDRNAAVRETPSLIWLFTYSAGLDGFDLQLMASRGVVLTNGPGMTSAAVAEYAVLGMLTAAKRYDEVVRLRDRRQWTEETPGRGELEGARALIVGYGAVGRAIGRRLAGFDVAVTGVTRTGRDGALGPDQWRDRLGEFDWVVLAAPVTGETQSMIGAAELAAMKPTAWLVNFGRGALVDQRALLEALRGRVIAGAFLDVTTPEPLPADDPVWTQENCLLSMHLSGRSQTSLLPRAVDLFLANLEAHRQGAPMRNVVDLVAGY
jgi:phosphoglycerate dehydrogenase-like enzyme